jgi:hypothetical protein
MTSWHRPLEDTIHHSSIVLSVTCYLAMAVACYNSCCTVSCLVVIPATGVYVTIL